MRILSIDSASDILSVVISENGKIVFAKQVSSLAKHSEFLLPLVEEGLKSLNIELKDVDYFGVVVGAGSFTGIRVGLSTMKAFSDALGIKVVPVTLSECLAYNISGENDIVSVNDAKQNKVYVQHFFNGEKTEEIEVVNLECFNGYMANKKNAVVVSNFSIEKFYNGKCVVANSIVNGLNLATFINIDKAVDGNLVSAIYVRKPQAEEELCRKKD